MVDKINNQKKVTRDALAFVAEISRDRSIFTGERRSESEIMQPPDNLNDSISVVSTMSYNDTETTKLRNEKLMMFLQKSAISQ